MKEAQHLIVEGRVQGVGFRHFVKTQADALNLAGWVRNLCDGRVEAFAQGDGQNMAKFVERLNRGPARAKVERVEVRKIGLQENVKEFEIGEDGGGPCINF